MNFLKDKDAPNIPKEVRDAFRNNKLVLFCGAGISRKAGLPSFKDLVTEVCKKLNVCIEDDFILKDAREKEEYDHMLGVIESYRHVGRKKLIETIMNILTEYAETPPNVNIHKDLLSLSSLPNNKGYRLVTTNMDRLFHEAELNLKLVEVDIGPKLMPIRQWKNLTFLHGLIDKEKDPEDINLVLTRKDFGQAYLQDGWANRFVQELLQEFTILFIGYSLNDPAIRSLVSAISPDDHKGIYAFADYEENSQGKRSKSRVKEQWKSNGVVPILYKIKRNEDHSLLYDSIKQWMKLSKSGLKGRKWQLKEEQKYNGEWANLKQMHLRERKQWLKEKLKCEGQSPQEFQASDRLLVKSVFSFLKIDGRLSEYLPQINPHISLLNLISELPVNESTQQISGIDTKFQRQPQLLDSLVTPSYLIRSNGALSITETDLPIWKEPLSPLEHSISRWLCKNLNKKETIHWIIKNNCTLHPILKKYIQLQIERFEAKHPNKLNIGEREYLFWKTISDLNYSLMNSYTHDLLLLTYSLNEKSNPKKDQEKIKEFINLLEPYIEFKHSLEGIPESNKFEETPEFNKLYRAEIRIHSRNYPPKLTNKAILLQHAENFSDLLNKAMQKAEQFEMIQNDEDYFYIHRPSIADHEQNKDYRPWTYLIDLARDSFDLAMEKRDKEKAQFLLHKWQQYPYSVFYRLILYAVTKYPKLDEKIVIRLFKKSDTLWSVTCQNEVLKYLKHRKYSKKIGEELIKLIIQGPPRSRFKESVNDEQFEEHKERDIYIRLKRLKNSSNIQFSKEVQSLYEKIQKKYKLSDSISSDDKEDFPFYSKKTRIVGSEKKYHNLSPQKIYEDIKLINVDTPRYKKDDKRENFRYLVKDIPQRAYETLLLSIKNEKANAPPYHFSPFFGTFISEIGSISNIKAKEKYFFDILRKIENFSDDFFKENLWAYVQGFKLFSSAIYEDRNYFRQWWNKLWNLSIESTDSFDEEKDIPMEALNSYMGKISESIFDILWNKYTDKIPKDDKIPEDIKKYFKVIIDNAKEFPFILYHFGVDLRLFWHLDKEWVLKNIKLLLDIKNESLSKSIWAGYLHNPRWSIDFLSDFKQEIFDLIINRQNMFPLDGNKNEHYLENIAGIFFTATGGTWSQNIFSNEQIKQLKRKIDVDMLKPISHQMWQQLQDAKDQSENLWSKKIKPWIKTFYPPSEDIKHHSIALHFSLAVLYTGDELPNALSVLEPHIKGVVQHNNDIMTLHINKSCFDIEKERPDNRITEPHQLDSIFKYPKELLKLLKWNIPKEKAGRMIEGELKKILSKIKSENPGIEENEDYKTLEDKLDQSVIEKSYR